MLRDAKVFMGDNWHLLMERHNDRSPTEAREHPCARAAAAA